MLLCLYSILKEKQDFFLLLSILLLPLYSNAVWIDIIKTMKDIVGHTMVTKTLLRVKLTLL